MATSNVCGLAADDIARDYIPARPEGPPDTKGVSADPDLAWDRGRFGADGRVYLAYLDKPSPDEPGNENHDTDVHLLVNDSPLDDAPGNHSWVPWNGTGGRINTDGSGASQFFHRIAVDQETGHVAISWYDARGEPLDLTKVRFFATHTSSLVPLTFVPEFPVLADEAPSDGTPLPGASQAQAQGTLGDYTGIDFGGGAFYPAWANNSGADGNPEPGKPDLFTSAVAVTEP